MMDLLVVALLVVIASLLGWLIRVAKQILATIELNAEFQSVISPSVPLHGCHGFGSFNYSTWRYSEKGWHLVEKRLDDDFEAGDPPRRPGAYEGEIVRRPAVRKGSR